MDLTSSDADITCPICMESWTVGTEHCPCCLKCGHLYGRSCIEQWIKEKGKGAKCPSCNEPIKKSDIRNIWCRAIKALDGTETMELQRLLADKSKQLKEAQATNFHSKLRLDLLHEDIINLKKVIEERDNKIYKMQSIISRLAEPGRAETDEAGRISPVGIDVDVQPCELKGKFHLATRIESSDCKAFSHCPISSILLVAQPAPTRSHIFGEFGLKKFSTLDTNVREFIPLHSKTITSVMIKPIGDLVLTASQDRQIKLTSITNNTCIHSYRCQYEPAYLSWSLNRDQQFYAGFANCYIALYDMRNTSEHIYLTRQKVASTRLMSIASVFSDQCDGLLVNDIKGSQFLKVSAESDYESESIDPELDHLPSHQLPFDGLMGSVDYHKPSGLSLVTTRRSPRELNITHNLVRLNFDDGEFSCEPVKTFTGGRTDLLSQSKILKHPTLRDDVLVGAADESKRGIILWDASDSKEYQTIRTDAFVRDMIMHTPEDTNQHILYTLSEKGINIYRWDYA